MKVKEWIQNMKVNLKRIDKTWWKESEVELDRAIRLIEIEAKTSDFLDEEMPS
jgi:hypothetical protein